MKKYLKYFTCCITRNEENDVSIPLLPVDAGVNDPIRDTIPVGSNTFYIIPQVDLIENGAGEVITNPMFICSPTIQYINNKMDSLRQSLEESLSQLPPTPENERTDVENVMEVMSELRSSLQLSSIVSTRNLLTNYPAETEGINNLRQSLEGIIENRALEDIEEVINEDEEVITFVRMKDELPALQYVESPTFIREVAVERITPYFFPSGNIEHLSCSEQSPLEPFLKYGGNASPDADAFL